MPNINMSNEMSIAELMGKFGAEEQAVNWLEDVRWNGKPVCPHCNDDKGVVIRKGKQFIYRHKACRKEFTVKTGSAMHTSNLPVQKWAMAVYLMLTGRKGISSLQLSKQLGITQKSAWYMEQRIRESFGKDLFKVSRVVEADETYIGGKEANKHVNKKLKAGWGSVGKTAVVGMRGRGGKVKAMPIERTDSDTLHTAIKDNVQTGSTIYTDDFRSYIGVEKLEHRHSTVKHSAQEYVDGMVHTNGIESVWAVLKRGIGAYHHISNKHLGRYVDEFAFRLNEGNCEVDTIDRMESWGKLTGGKRISYSDLVK